MAIAAHVKTRIGDLRSKSTAELAALPETASEDLDIAGKRVTLTVYREPRSTGEVLVVVQALRKQLLGIGANVWAEGFVLSPSGEKLDAPAQLLWDYM